jgi:diguanylate cyclase (GGDEF)-like protein/PAS domain S-box-containing protein
MPEPEAGSRSLLLRRRSSPYVVVAIGLIVTIACFVWARKTALTDFAALFEEHAKVRAGMIVQEIEEGMLIVKSVGQFCEEGHTSALEFSAFTAPLLRQHPQVGNIAWVPAGSLTGLGTDPHPTVRQKERGQLRRPGDTGERELAAAQGARRPILCFKSLSRGNATIPSDLSSDPVLFSALEKARNSGQPVAISSSQKRAVVLDSQSSFLVALPVYAKRQTSDQPDRRRSLLGFVLGTLRTEAMLSTFLTMTEPERFSVEILDPGADYGERVLCMWSSHTRDGATSLRSFLLPASPSYLLRFFAGKEWGIRISPTQSYMEANYSLAYWLLLPGGLLATFLLALLILYLRTVLFQKESMERVVQERTADLLKHEQDLERLVSERTESLRWKSAFLEALTNTSEDGILVTDTEEKRIFYNPRSLDLWRIPREVAEQNDDDAWTRHVLGVVRDPDGFDQTVQYLRLHPDEVIHDEIELRDGSVLERDSCPVLAENGKRYGRVFRFRDITERKRAEEALRESEERCRIAIDNSNDGIALAKEGTKYFVNRRYLEMFGYEREEEALGIDDFGRVHPDDRERVRSMMARRARGEAVPTRYEFKGIRKDGVAVEVELTLAAVTYRGEEVSLIHFHDITERKKAEQALRESENKFRDLAEKSIVGVYLIQDGLFRYVNSRFAEIHGYTAEEVIDRVGVKETVTPEDVPGVQEGIRKRMSGELDLVRREFGIVTKQGNVRDVEIYGTHTVYRGRKAIIGTLLDVTERKQTEAMLRWKTAFLEAQVNSSLDGILVVDDQGNHILQNQRTTDMWKIPQVILDDPDHTRRFGHIVGMAKNARQFRQKVDFLRRNPDQTSRDEIELTNGTVLDTYSCPVRGGDGNHYGRIWTFRDITELRHYWDMLENLSATDGLTDLPNRRRFDDFLDREWRRNMRDQSRLSLILMDIDFFKEFNDHYGHLAGDDCLRHVARVLQEAMQRPGDLVARYGGEEFACILPDTDSPGAVVMANKIRDRIKQSNIPHFFSSVADHITLSFGVATLVPSKGESPSALIQLADKLLYAAKQNGRDQVMNWQQSAKGRRANES